jgi:excisionase family DNA binding protein
VTELEPIERRAYTVREVAEMLGVCEKHILRLCQRGELAHVRLGRRIVIHREVLDALLEKAKA